MLIVQIDMEAGGRNLILEVVQDGIGGGRGLLAGGGGKEYDFGGGVTGVAWCCKEKGLAGWSLDGKSE